MAEAHGLPEKHVELAKLLANVQCARDQAGIPRLELNRYLQCRAQVIEAEEQLRLWGQRLAERKQAMSRGYASYLDVLLGVDDIEQTPH